MNWPMESGKVANGGLGEFPRHLNELDVAFGHLALCAHRLVYRAAPFACTLHWISSESFFAERLEPCEVTNGVGKVP